MKPILTMFFNLALYVASCFLISIQTVYQMLPYIENTQTLFSQVDQYVPERYLAQMGAETTNVVTVAWVDF